MPEHTHSPETTHLHRVRDLIQTAFDTAYEGIVITDPNGIIIMINQTYAHSLKVSAEEVVGKHCTEVIENTRMHIVAQTGKAELAQVQRINGREMIAHRIPIFEQGKVVAVIGQVLFQDVRELHALSAHVQQLTQELNYYKGEFLKKVGAQYDLDDIIGTSEPIEDVKRMVRRIATADTAVLISGENGTGKELFAHAIHKQSRRKLGPFIRINCAAIPETLIESVLFGYEEGAFTGSSKGGRKGKFEMAHHGTIFLDEIGELTPTMQAKLLRVLQEKEIEPVGGIHPIKIDVRIVAASNRDLEQMVREGTFRQDLFYRLHVISLRIPPLRERKEDIPLLTHYFLQKCAQEVGGYVSGIDAEAMQHLIHHDWPGNVRELKNVIERAVILLDDEVVKSKHLPFDVEQELSDPSYTLAQAVEKAEKERIQQVLKLTNGDRNHAMQLLDISKSSFYQKLNKYQIRLD